MDIKKYRKSKYNIDPIYLRRWSSRAFANKSVESDKLMTILEAARWAPSANNMQPWRFIVAESKEERNLFMSFINESNQVWCRNAPILIAVVSKTIINEGGSNISHAFDTGTAWGYLSLEATRQGLLTHALGGFNRDKAREALQLPNEYDFHAIVAVGYYDKKADLPSSIKEREVPSLRNPIDQFVFKGKYTEAFVGD